MAIGCRIQPPVKQTGTSIETGPPALVELAWSCDADDEEWLLTATADAWSGGGALYLTVDGDYIEAHGVRSAEAAADGTSDELELELGIEADWREVSPGSSTAFTCGDAPSALFLLYDLEGDASDCLIIEEPAVAWQDIEDGPSCD